MARLVLTCALVLSPTTPIVAHPQMEQPWTDAPLISPRVFVVDSPPPDWYISPPASISAPTPDTTLATPELQVVTDTPPPPPPPILTLRERALNRLVELGAPAWVVQVFDCIGWFESRWRNVRSATGDDGVFQINDVHDAELARRGLDPYVPEDAADYAWSLSRWGATFTPWSVHALCGV